ncbi:MAG TPA: ABC transporter permease subunit [Opitutaceae bacterium]|nr:ABC transporter permease subunit [Opitutaceae bacterium]
MATKLDLSRWRVRPHGVGYRRWTILFTGLRLLLRTRFFRLLVAVAWSAGLAIAVLGFVFSQSIASGGWLETLAAHSSARLEAIVIALGGFVSLYPDICVRGIFTLIFWVHSFVGLWFTLIALTVLIPRLITRDRASNALTIYLSRPLTTLDYLLGKLGMILGIILLTWTGPLVFGWLVSMLFATNRDFIVYSIAPLARALAFNGIALVALAAIALGVSALARTARNTTILWIGLWIIAGTMASPPHAPAWIRRASFSHDLGEVRERVLRLDTALSDAATQLPLLNPRFATSLSRAGERSRADDFGGALAGLGVFVIASSLVFTRLLRPE